MAAILTTKEDAQGVEENIDPKNFHLWGQPTPKQSLVPTFWPLPVEDCLNPGILKAIK